MKKRIVERAIPAKKDVSDFLVREARRCPLVVVWLSMLTFIVSMMVRTERIVGRSLSIPVLLVLFAAAGLPGVGSSTLLAANLSPKTVRAFDTYVKLSEARMKREESKPGDFLYIETLPKPQYDAVISTLKNGGVYVQPVHTRDAEGDPINIPGGMIHHWVGDIFIPDRTISSVLEVLRDYNDFKNIYKPEIIRSHLISRKDDNDYKIYLRMQKKSVVTVTLDTWYQVHFTPLGPNRGYSRSVSTRIQQVEDAGTPNEHLDPVGQDSGFLWRINSYWRYEQYGNGVIIEWESIALSRQIPFLLAWFVKPLIRSIARETVQDMLTATRKAVLAEKPQGAEARNHHRSSSFSATSFKISRGRQDLKQTEKNSTSQLERARP